MPGALLDSPAAILAQLLVDNGLGNAYTSATWPVFYGAEPDSPDACITVRDYPGVIESWSNVTHEPHERHGIQVRVRASTHTLGYAKIRAIAEAMNTMRGTVTVSGTDYCVVIVHRTGGINPLGKDIRTNRNQIFTVNCLVLLRRV